jgi:hypothetical protein
MGKRKILSVLSLICVFVGLAASPVMPAGINRRTAV